MRMIKWNKTRITLSLIIVYGLKALYLLSYKDIEKDGWILFSLSFLLVYFGILGHKYKIYVFEKSPLGPVLSYTRSYNNTDDLATFLGDLQNVLTVISGTVLFLII